jgi:ElaB/YqjD/DUF883 family membrane-anchored ribosome-binding protein
MSGQPIPNTNDIQKSATPEAGADIKDGLFDKARQASAALTETAQRVGDQAKETASSLASDAQQRFHGYMDQQVAASADLAGQVASVIKTAADELDRTSPALGGVVRSAGERVQDLSRQIRDKTADEVLADTRDFARRKPALVFGAAAALGFVAYRVLNTGMSQSAAPERRYAGADDWRRNQSNVPSRTAPAGFQPHNNLGPTHAD